MALRADRYADFAAAAFFAFFLANFFARLVIPAETFTALCLFRRVSSILE
jgi:hypothetical protein